MSAAAQKLDFKNINLIIKSGPHTGEQFTLTKEVITIGRGPDNDIAIIKDLQASRNHARVHIRDDQVIIENVSEKNHISVDGKVVPSKSLQPDQEVTIGETKIQFKWTPQNDAQNIAPLSLVNNQQSTPQNALQNILQNNLQVPPQLVPTGPNQLQNHFQNVNHSQKTFRPTPNRQKTNNKKPLNINFIIIILIVIGGAFFFFKDKTTTKGNKTLSLRTDEQIKKDLEEQRNSIETYKKSKSISEDGELENAQATSQSYYVKGFRDYRLGQFGRSIQSFQASLSFNPEHVLSRKYLTLAIRKQDELIDFNMLQGRRYRDKGNFRLCKSAYQQVMIIRKDPTDKKYKEAKQMFDACDTLAKGRY